MDSEMDQGQGMDPEMGPQADSGMDLEMSFKEDPDTDSETGLQTNPEPVREADEVGREVGEADEPGQLPLFDAANDDDSLLSEGGMEESLITLKEQVKKVPQLPGVYLWKNAEGKVIYVGKAKLLRNRMMQYIMQSDERFMIPFMMSEVRSFDYIVVNNEHEALVLEKNLINQYDPYYNVDFRDDKSYPFIAIEEGNRFPAIKFTREKHRSTTRYFGPYTDSRSARKLIDVVRHVVPICSTSCEQYRAMHRAYEKDGEYSGANGGKPCFDYNVGLGPGPCCGMCTESEYAESVAKVEKFLSGQRREFLSTLEADMKEAAANLDFEKAARIRNRIAIVNSLKSEQHVELSRDLDCDVVGVFREETVAGVNVFVVREGTIINTCEFVLDKGRDVPMADLLETFLVRYYDQTTDIPKEVVIEEPIEETQAIEQWLTEKLASKHGAKVHIRIPSRGEKSDLLQMAKRNANHSLQRFKIRTRYDESRVNDALLELESALALPGPPMRIECYDISTIHGKYSVASMVVFTAGRVDSSQYRRFRIKMETPEANDVAMMRETLERRFSEKNRNDERFGKMPDLIVLDGGKPQLNAVVKQFEEMGIDDVPLAGLAKSDEELFVTWSDEPVYLPLGSAALYLVKHVRDEAHRFAITYHRQLRGKGMTQSVLDSVPGLGPKRKRLLLRTFGSVKNMRKLTVDQIAEVKGIPREVAEEVVAVLDQIYGDGDKTRNALKAQNEEEPAQMDKLLEVDDADGAGNADDAIDA